MPLSRPILLAWLLCAGFLSASETPPAPPPVAPRILDGQDAPVSDFPTLALVGDTTGFFCSGTLIAPNVVLSAGHCAADDTGRLTVDGTNARIMVGATVYRATRIVTHPTYSGFQGPKEGQFDASLWFLEAPVPGVTPSPLFRQAPTVGTTLTLAGFGELGSGALGGNGQFPAPGRLDFGNTNIEKVTGTFIKWLFDPGEADTAPGDSGGPAFITVDGVRQVAGITSGGTKEVFGDRSYDVRVDAIAGWIDQMLNPSTFMLTSGPLAVRNPARPGEPMSFSAEGNAPDVTWAWDFGDGSPSDPTAPTVFHTYAAEGTFTVTLTVTRTSTGQTVTGTLSVLISATAPPGPATFTPVDAPRRKFQLNFKKETSSKFELQLESATFIFADKVAFAAALVGTRAQIFFDAKAVDAFSLTGTKSTGDFGDGKLSWNFKKGQVRYQLKGLALNEFLPAFGATDQNVTGKQVSLPFFLQTSTGRFGGFYTFTYNATAGKSGKGQP